MDYDIYFCNDGVMRAKYRDDLPMIPLEFIQKNEVKCSDLRFWSSWWENNVYFEDGLTVGKFLICLEPWSNFWSDITLKNIKAYIAEARKPIAVFEKEQDRLDWVSVAYITEVSPSVEYKKEERDEDFSISEWLNSPKESRLTGEWDIHSHYKITGYIKNKEEQYSIEHTPMNELANVKIVLEEKQVLYADDWQLKRHVNSGDNFVSILNENTFGVFGHKTESRELSLIGGKKYHKLRDVIEGFFWWMYSEPTKRDEFNEYLKESIEQIKEYEDESVEKQTNVIPLFPNNSSDDESKEDKKMTVKVAPGAFDSLINRSIKEKDYWDYMLEKAKDDNSVVLKIGNVSLNDSNENRCFSYILKEEDLPKGTDYRLI